MLYDAVLQILNTSAEIPEPDEAQRHKSWTSPDERKPAGAFTEEIGKYYRFPTGPQNCKWTSKRVGFLWLISGTDNDEDHCAQATIDTSQYELHHQHYHSVLECEHCPYCEYYYYPQCGPQLIHAFVVNLPLDVPQECDHDPECEYMCYPQPGSRALLYALA